jgi:hypothetical protein
MTAGPTIMPMNNAVSDANAVRKVRYLKMRKGEKYLNRT